MSFAHPHVLLLLPVLALLAAMALRNPFVRSGLPGSWKRVIAPDLAGYLAAQSGGHGGARVWVFAPIAVLLVIALARPLIDLSERTGHAAFAGRVIVLDLPRGAEAGQTRSLATDLLDRSDGIATAIIAVAGEAYTIVPLTTDRAQIDRYLGVLTAGALPYAGRSIHLGFAEAEALFARQSLAVRQIVLVTAEPPPDTLVEIAGSASLRSIVTLRDAGAWQVAGAHFGAEVVAADRIGQVGDRLQAAIAARARTALPGAAIDLVPWCVGLVMILWLTLFRRRADA